MKRKSFEDHVISELQDIKNDMKQVRTVDIPGLKSDVSGFHEKIRSLEKSQAWSTRLYTVIGGAIAVAVAKFTGAH